MTASVGMVAVVKMRADVMEEEVVVDILTVMTSYSLQLRLCLVMMLLRQIGRRRMVM